MGSPTQPSAATPPQPSRAGDPQLDIRKPRGLDGGGEVLPRLERADGKDVVAVDGWALRGEDGVDAVRDDADPLDRDPQQFDELVARERRDRDDRVRCAHARAQRESAGRPVPARECLRMAENREIVDGDDERRPRRDGSAERRAVEDVDVRGGVAEAERVPERVASQCREPSRAARRQADELEPRPSFELAEEPEHVACGSGARLHERCRVDRDPHLPAALRIASRGSG